MTTTDHADIAADVYRMALRIAAATRTMDTATLRRVQVRLVILVNDCSIPPMRSNPGCREVMQDGE